MLKIYSRNELTWPVALLFAFVMWILNAITGIGGKTVFEPLTNAFFDYTLGLLACAAIVYVIAEVNTRHYLLANSDRTISLTLMLLIVMSTFLHPLQANQLTMMAYLVSYLYLFGASNSKQPQVLAFIAAMMLGVVTLVMPQMVWMIGALWVSLVILRIFSLKALVASLLGVALPYWFWAVIAAVIGKQEPFHLHLDSMTSFGHASFDVLSTKQLWCFGVVLAMTIVGIVYFFKDIHLNRSNARINFYVVCFKAVIAFFFIWLEPECFQGVYPLCLVNAAFLWGRFCSFSKGRMPDILWTSITIAIILTTFIG